MRYIHIIAGLIALVSGAIALYAPKGSTLHRRSGMVFVAAMLVMTSAAIIIAGFLRPEKINVIAGTLTFYLVCTALLAVRRTVAQARGLLTGLMIVAFAGSVFAFATGIEAANSVGGTLDGIPPQPLYMFGIVGLAGALLDARLLWAGSIQGAHRIARHLWRMTFAMWIATASFFLGQAKFFPEPIRKSGLLVIPVVLVLVLLVYWLARVLILRRRSMRDVLGRRAARESERRSAARAEVPPGHPYSR